MTVNDELHGMFQIDSQGTAFSEDMLARCRAMANVVELALGNAIAHQELEIQANTDPLTGLSNRRGLVSLSRAATGGCGRWASSSWISTTSR